MSSPRLSEQTKDEEKTAEIKKYCQGQTRPYRTASHLLSVGSGCAFAMEEFPAALSLFAGGLFVGSLESSKFEKCVREEEAKATTTKQFK